MAKSYEDIGKDANEFITKGFPNSGLFKLTAEIKTPNGVSVRSAGSRSFDYKDKDNIEEKLSAEVEPKYKQEDIEFSAKLSTAGEYELGATLENIGTKGTKASFTATQSDSAGNALKGNVAFKNDLVSTKVGLKYPFKQPTHANWNGEVTYRHEKLHVGANVLYDQAIRGKDASEKDQPKDRLVYNVKGGYISNEQQVVLSVEQQANRDKKSAATVPILSIFSFNYLYALSAALKVGFGASIEKHSIKGTEVHTAVEYKVDKDTVVKSKLSVVNAPVASDLDFRVALGVKQNITERVNVTVGADVNARTLIGAPGKGTISTKPHSFGFEVKFQ